MASKGKKRSVLFICLGNICRSPIAEAIFKQLVEEQGVSAAWEIDSAALGTWHIGKGPDHRAMTTLEKNGHGSYRHRARELTKADFTHYDVIFGMDDANMRELDERKPKNYTAKLKRLISFDPQKDKTIRDPYFDNQNELSGFQYVFEQCKRCCEEFLKDPDRET